MLVSEPGLLPVASWEAPTKAVMMKPACAIEEYASIRFTSVWVIASTEPTAIVATAMIAISGCQSQRSPPRPT